MTSNSIDMTPPTGAEYVGQAARTFLDILSDVAQEVPIPAFGAAVKIAVRIMKTCDDNQTTLESAEELRYRIQELFKVMVDKLKGKTLEELHPDLITEIGTLQTDMVYVKKTLDKITSQPRIFLVVFPSLNDNRIKKCTTRVNNAMERFNLVCNINNTNTLAQVKRQLDFQQLTMKELLDQLVTERTSSRAPIPALNSAVFHGRGSLVAELVAIVTGSSTVAGHSSQHICLLGPGGMGKTWTSLAVMGHPKVKAHFADHLRVWVPCVKATSVSLFIDTLQSSLAIPKEAGDTRGAVLSTLRASPPIVILLDNFETPWDAEGAQLEVAQILRDIHNIPHVTLFMTMRSSTPPCDDIPWHHVDLRGVDATAAQEIYVTKYSKGRYDSDLPHLLALICYMPLAITIMAKVAKVTQLSAADLMNEYNKSGTSMLGQGSDAVSSMDVCIGLSVYSSRMKAHPEAFDLLCALSMLPTGTSYKMLSTWWAGNIPNLPGALEVLKDVSLVEERGSIYFVLPVIQRYILDSTRFRIEIRTSMIESACTFLKQHESKIGDPLYKEHLARLSPEETNLEAVLLQVTIPDPYVIRNGLLSLAHYQQNNRPRVDVIEHALRLAQALDDNLLRGDILYCYGDISETLREYDRSLKQLLEALNLFLTVSDKKKAAKSRLKISRVLTHYPGDSFDMRRQILLEARAEFESVDDEIGVGLCFSALGDLNRFHGNFSTASTLIEKAEDIFANSKIKDQYSHTECTRNLVFVYYWIREYDRSYSYAASLLEECKTIGDTFGCGSALSILGKMASACGDYKCSFEHHLNSLKVSTAMGLPPSGCDLQGLGLAWAKLGKTVDACRAFTDALEQYSSEKSGYTDETEFLCTQFFLKYFEDPQLCPTTHELSALYRCYTPDHLTRILSPAM